MTSSDSTAPAATAAVAHADMAAASPLGKTSPFPPEYDPSVLFPIARAPQRARIGITGEPRFMGADVWTAYELSWLNRRGKPHIALAHFVVPAQTPYMAESKSLKLYLGSYNHTRFADEAEVRERLQTDLTALVWGEQPRQSAVGVQLVLPDAFEAQRVQEMEGTCLDRLEIECMPAAQPEPHWLQAAVDEQPVQEVLSSRLLRSNCPVTGQPDWGSVQFAYTGPQIDQAGLLRYVLSFRDHSDFHEHCVERMFIDIWQRCRPSRLSVYARYTRRGGLDINPWRSSHPAALPSTVRTARQ